MVTVPRLINNIASCLLHCINDKGCYSQSYGKNHNMPEISILVDNCGGHNNNNVMIRFLNIIKEGGLFGVDTLYFYIKEHTNNDRERTFNSLKGLYRKKMSLLLRSAVKFWISEIMLDLFKYSMKTSVIWYHSWVISTTDLILKLSMLIISSMWKRIWNTSVIVKSSTVRNIQNTIIRRTIHTEIHNGI